MKRSTAIALVILVAAATVIPMHFTVTHLVVAGSFTDHPTSITHDGKRYHILPESKLKDDVVILLDETGTRYYVLSEKKLRLLGPKLLGGSE